MSASLAGNVIVPLCGFASAPILAHGLGVTDRGVVAGATAPLLLLTALAALGLPEAVTFFTARNVRTSLDRYIWSLIVVSAAGLAFSVMAWSARDWLLEESASGQKALLLSLFALVPNLWVAVARGFAAGFASWGFIAAERAVTAVSRLAVLAVLLFTGDLNIVSASAAIALTPVLGVVVYISHFLVVARNQAKWRSPRAPSVRFRELLRYSSGIWLGAVSGVLLSRLDQVLMIPLSSPDELGLYVVAVAVSELPLVLTNSVREVIFSAHSGERDDSLLVRASRVSTAFVWLVSLILASNLWWLMVVVFGSQFKDSIVVAAVLLLSVALGTGASIAGAGISARGRPEVRSIGMLLACLVNLVAMFLLVPKLGAFGAGLATLAGTTTAGAYNLAFSRKILGIPGRRFMVFGWRDYCLIFDLLNKVLSQTVGRSR